MQIAVKNAHSLSIESVSEEFSVSIERGLTDGESKKRLQVFGRNELVAAREKSLWFVFFNQFKSLIVYLLVAAGLVSVAFGDHTEAIAIFIVILVNAGIGFLMETQARKSMDALRQLDTAKARVVRGGNVIEVPSGEVVPGDILFVEAGDLVCADARLVTVSQLSVDESALTGESMPVSKKTGRLSSNAVLADQVNMVFKGTVVMGGNGRAVVTATGMKTELGMISSMVQSTVEEAVPLNEKLEAFSKKLVLLTIIIILPLLIVGLLEDREIKLMIKSTIALAVAAIPEGLPIVATIALARGMLKLSKHQVIVKKLAAVETLGSTNIIFTDKTGTLTENRLAVSEICLPGQRAIVKWKEKGGTIIFDPHNIQDSDHQNLEKIITIGVICNNASVTENNSSGDPLEVALLKLGTSYSSTFLDDVTKRYPRIDEKPFDSETKMMATVHESGDKIFVAVKGAPEEIIKTSTRFLRDGNTKHFKDGEKKEWITRNDTLARNGLRSLAFAYSENSKDVESAMDDLIFAGLVGFIDPPREEVRDAMIECHRAGIRVVMVTGDHAETAKHIASDIGLTENSAPHVIHGQKLKLNDKSTDDEIKAVMEADVFARVSPKQKLDLVDLYQNDGWIVAMTGDGVNDAPALKKADIGIAMGQRGTQVARDAATMILQNDSFASIVTAVKYGRIIFDNIRSFIIYLLSCNLSEILIVALASFMNLALPLQPLQILFLNIVTDVFPALALGMSDGGDYVMKRKPRNPDQPIITRKYWISIVTYSLMLTLSVYAVFLYSYYSGDFTVEMSNNIAFFSLAFAQLLHPFNLASGRTSFFKNEITTNRHLWLAIAFCIALIVTVYLVPPFNNALSLYYLPASAWVLILIGSVLHLFFIQVLKRFHVIV